MRPPIQSLLPIDDRTGFQRRKGNVPWLLRYMSIALVHDEAFICGKWGVGKSGVMGNMSGARKSESFTNRNDLPLTRVWRVD